MTSDTQTALRLTRIVQAPRERAYRAWLEPEVVRRWMAPHGKSVKQVIVDERVGGHYEVWLVDEDGNDTGGFDWELLELVEGERIVASWRFVGPDREHDPSHDSLLTVEFRDAPGGATELTLVHERLEAFAAAMPEVGANVATGWNMALDNLVSLFSAT